jgi:hypothetical protein
MPEVERLRMLYNMIDKIRADLVKLTIVGGRRVTCVPIAIQNWKRVQGALSIST